MFDRKARQPQPKWSFFRAVLEGDLSEARVSRRFSTMPGMNNRAADPPAIDRARAEDCDTAWEIIEEYYEAAGVIARDAKEDFERVYFRDGAGVWLAVLEEIVVGCIALRPLGSIAHSGEVKRLYVQPRVRGRGIAAALYRSLELYAREYDYEWLYLDTADEMAAAQRCYASLGFELTTRYNDNPQATIFMRKALRASSR
jgi:GNAT superfamily N-acetyltransferase